MIILLTRPMSNQLLHAQCQNSLSGTVRSARTFRPSWSPGEPQILRVTGADLAEGGERGDRGTGRSGLCSSARTPRARRYHSTTCQPRRLAGFGLAREVFAAGSDGELAVLDTFSGDEFVGDLLDGPGPAAHGQDFQAVVVVQVDVQR